MTILSVGERVAGCSVVAAGTKEAVGTGVPTSEELEGKRDGVKTEGEEVGRELLESESRFGETVGSDSERDTMYGRQRK